MHCDLENSFLLAYLSGNSWVNGEPPRLTPPHSQWAWAEPASRVRDVENMGS